MKTRGLGNPMNDQSHPFVHSCQVLEELSVLCAWGWTVLGVLGQCLATSGCRCCRQAKRTRMTKQSTATTRVQTLMAEAVVSVIVRGGEVTGVEGDEEGSVTDSNQSQWSQQVVCSTRSPFECTPVHVTTCWDIDVSEVVAPPKSPVAKNRHTAWNDHCSK